MNTVVALAKDENQGLAGLISLGWIKLIESALSFLLMW